jgi:hypothetical protein
MLAGGEQENRSRRMRTVRHGPVMEKGSEVVEEPDDVGKVDPAVAVLSRRDSRASEPDRLARRRCRPEGRTYAPSCRNDERRLDELHRDSFGSDGHGAGRVSAGRPLPAGTEFHRQTINRTDFPMNAGTTRWWSCPASHEQWRNRRPRRYRTAHSAPSLFGPRQASSVCAPAGVRHNGRAVHKSLASSEARNAPDSQVSTSGGPPIVRWSR